MSSSSSRSVINLEKDEVVGGKWRIKFSIGSGAFGAVYLVERIGTTSNRKYAAMKVEARMEEEEDEVLRMDVFVLSKVQDFDKFCTIYDYSQNERFSYVVMTLIGPSTLDDLRRKEPGRRFSKVSSLKIGIQLISALSRLHAAGFIHRDIKPANIAPGYRRRNVVFLFDFGLARFIYEDEQKTRLRRRRSKVSFRGTYRYCSKNAHKNGDQGRVDDMWGALYTLIELCTGRLPWSGQHPKESCKLKQRIPDSELFKDCPPSFLNIKGRLDKLQFEDTPDYNAYQLLMYRDVLNYGGRLDSKFEWEVNKNGGMWSQDRRSDEGQAGKREAGDSDTIRSATESLTGDVPASTASLNQESIHKGIGSDPDDVYDTLDDVPDDILLDGVKKVASKIPMQVKNRAHGMPAEESYGQQQQKTMETRTGNAEPPNPSSSEDQRREPKSIRKKSRKAEKKLHKKSKKDSSKRVKKPSQKSGKKSSKKSGKKSNRKSETDDGGQED